MSVLKGRVLSCLILVLLLSVAAAAQGEPPLLSVVAVPGGGVQLLVTRLQPSSLAAHSTLVAAGGSSSVTGAGGGLSPTGEALPSPAFAQRFLTRYTDVFGWKHTLETSEQDGETPDAHALRHAAALAGLLAQFPPAPDASSSLGSSLLEPGEQVLKTGWKGADGLDHEVITARKAGENMDKWAERHADGVAALLKVFPPKPSLSAAGTRGALRVA